MSFRSFSTSALCVTALTLASSSSPAPALRDAVAKKIAADYPSLEAIYQDLHVHP